MEKRMLYVEFSMTFWSCSVSVAVVLVFSAPVSAVALLCCILFFLSRRLCITFWFGPVCPLATAHLAVESQQSKLSQQRKSRASIRKPVVGIISSLTGFIRTHSWIEAFGLTASRVKTASLFFSTVIFWNFHDSSAATPSVAAAATPH